MVLTPDSSPSFMDVGSASYSLRVRIGGTLLKQVYKVEGVNKIARQLCHFI